jgi:hypothetical protein
MTVVGIVVLCMLPPNRWIIVGDRLEIYLNILGKYFQPWLGQCGRESGTQFSLMYILPDANVQCSKTADIILSAQPLTENTSLRHCYRVGVTLQDLQLRRSEASTPTSNLCFKF